MAKIDWWNVIVWPSSVGIVLCTLTFLPCILCPLLFDISNAFLVFCICVRMSSSVKKKEKNTQGAMCHLLQPETHFLPTSWLQISFCSLCAKYCNSIGVAGSLSLSVLINAPASLPASLPAHMSCPCNHETPVFQTLRLSELAGTITRVLPWSECNWSNLSKDNRKEHRTHSAVTDSPPTRAGLVCCVYGGMPQQGDALLCDRCVSAGVEKCVLLI